MKENDLYTELTKLVDSAFDKHFKGKKMDTNQPQFTQPTQATAENSSPKYLTVEEYTKATGKRFRMTKEQVQREITREQAFAEFVKTLK
jgi:hypothetical protein